MPRLPRSPAFTLGLFASISAGLVTTVYLLTQTPIKAAEARWFQQRLARVLLPDEGPTGALSPSLIRKLPDVTSCGSCWLEAHLLERDDGLFMAGSPPVFAISTSSDRGYNGRIKVITGVRLVGEQQKPSIVAVEVSHHRETPGIGDRIETDKSPWLNQFRSQTVTDDIDGLSGATISAMAVRDAVDKALHFVHANQAQMARQVSP